MASLFATVIFAATSIVYLKPAHAECTSMTIDPIEGIRFSNLPFTVAIQNCDGPVADYTVEVLRGELGFINTNFFKIGEWDFQDIGNGQYVAPIPPLDAEEYTFILRRTGVASNLATENVVVQEVQGEVKIEYRCEEGTPPICLRCEVNPNEASTCVTASSSEQANCPARCPTIATTARETRDRGSETCKNNELDTAIGCIPFEDPNAFIGFFLKWAIGIASGVAFILIVYAGFIIMTSTGDPKKLQAGRELLTAAIAGLLLLIFSVFLLKIIGVDILKLPGLGETTTTETGGGGARVR